MEAVGGGACSAVDCAVAVALGSRKLMELVEGAVRVAVDAAEGLANEGDHSIAFRHPCVHCLHRVYGCT